MEMNTDTQSKIDNKSLTDTQSNFINITIGVDRGVYGLLKKTAKENDQSIRRMVSEAVLWWIMRGGSDCEFELSQGNGDMRLIWKSLLKDKKQTEANKMTRKKWHRRFPGIPYPALRDAPGDVQTKMDI